MNSKLFGIVEKTVRGCRFLDTKMSFPNFHSCHDFIGNKLGINIQFMSWRRAFSYPSRKNAYTFVPKQEIRFNQIFKTG